VAVFKTGVAPAETADGGAITKRGEVRREGTATGDNRDCCRDGFASTVVAASLSSCLPLARLMVINSRRGIAGALPGGGEKVGSSGTALMSGERRGLEDTTDTGATAVSTSSSSPEP
jgi:hypothetical protein